MYLMLVGGGGGGGGGSPYLSACFEEALVISRKSFRMM